jgi:hypothetical protein
LFIDRIDICEFAAENGLSCPFKAGDQVLTFKEKVDPEAPSVGFTLKAVLFNEKGGRLACVSGPVQISD